MVGGVVDETSPANSSLSKCPRSGDAAAIAHKNQGLEAGYQCAESCLYFDRPVANRSTVASIESPGAARPCQAHARREAAAILGQKGWWRRRHKALATTWLAVSQPATSNAYMHTVPAVVALLRMACMGPDDRKHRLLPRRATFAERRSVVCGNWDAFACACVCATSPFPSGARLGAARVPSLMRGNIAFASAAFGAFPRVLPVWARPPQLRVPE